jgi:hypothetical protein
MSWLSEFLNPGAAYNRAAQKEQQSYNESQGYRQPYLQYGQTGGNALTDFLNNLKDPAKLQDEWSKGYSESPYAKQLTQENTAQGMDQASAMGLGGSSAALQNVQKGAGDIMQKDRQNYMNDLMQKYLAGIGIGTNMFNTGAGMAEGAAGGAQRHGENQAEYTFGEGAANNQQRSTQIMALIAQMLGNAGTGGGFPGFPGMTSGMYGGS